MKEDLLKGAENTVDEISGSLSPVEHSELEHSEQRPELDDRESECGGGHEIASDGGRTDRARRRDGCSREALDVRQQQATQGLHR